MFCYKTIVPKKIQKYSIFHRRFSKMNSENQFKFAGIQLLVGADKEKNLENARKNIDIASKNGAQVISLPECFNCPYGNDFFPTYAETVPDGPSFKMLSEAAKANQVYLIGGSIPEKDAKGLLYNTSLIFDTKGDLIAKHRKVHLFDIDVPGQITFKESKTLTAGNTLTTFATKFCTIGVGICYDIRFPELAQLMKMQGSKFLVYPGAFNMVTGPAHWELLQRARAVDNQLYVAAVSPSRNPESSYQAWGHSTVVGPWFVSCLSLTHSRGNIVATTEHDPAIIYADIDLKRVDEVRAQIPTSKQKRTDMYELRHIS